MSPRTAISAASLVFSFAAIAMTPPAAAEDFLGVQIPAPLQGDERLACEALLCLSASSRPSECQPSISRYFGITKRKWSDTMDARRSFLGMCPPATANSILGRMVDLYPRTAGKCSAADLNRMQLIHDAEGREVIGISDQMPAICRQMFDLLAPDYYRADIPYYTGVIGLDGHWVDP